MGALDLLTANFNGRLIFSVSLVAVSAANYGFDNQGFSAAQAMTPFEKQFGYFDTTGTYAGTYQLQTSWLSLYSSVIWVGFAVGMVQRIALRFISKHRLTTSSGLVVGSEISARWGRRVGMLALSLWAIISSTIIVSSYSKWQILVGRILFSMSVPTRMHVVRTDGNKMDTWGWSSPCCQSTKLRSYRLLFAVSRCQPTNSSYK